MKAAPFPQLQAFLAVARLRSFSSAARELGVSRSAVSYSVRQLEDRLRVVLLTRTTRSVSLTDAGRRLVETAGPGLGQALAALANVGAQPGEAVGRLRLSAPRMAVAFVINPVLPTFRARHPRVEVEVDIEDRFVEVGAPSYLERHGTPEKPQDLLRHECITFRAQTTGTLYAWELERGRKTWRVPVRGGVVTNDSQVMLSLVESGLGLTYAFEPVVREQLRTGRLKVVLEAYAPTVPGFFLYFPSRAQRSPPLRLFIEAAKELAVRAL